MPARKGQGQWALGHREPLNQNERVKRDDDGLNVRQRIIDLYQHTGFDSIDPADLRGRFRWCGLYTQRAPGIHGGRTAMLEPEELDDEYFMLRVRIDGGALTSEQLRTIAGISTEFGRDVADVTDRQNVQLHWIRIEDVPRSGAGSRRSAWPPPRPAATPPRVILGCPLAGVAADEVIDATPAMRGDRRPLRRRPRVLQPAAQVQVADLRLPAPLHVAHEINDVSFVGVVTRSTARASTSGSAAGCRPTRCSASGWARSSRPTGRRGVGGRHRGLPRLRLPPAPQPRPAEVPARRLGHGAVPPGAGERVPGRALPDGPAPDRPRRRPRPRRRDRQVDGRLASASRRPGRPHHPARSSPGSPTSPTRTARAASAPPPSRS